LPIAAFFGVAGKYYWVTTIEVSDAPYCFYR